MSYGSAEALQAAVKPTAPAAVVLGASPAVYTALAKGNLVVGGGTVSQIRFSRDGGTTWTVLGITGGTIPVVLGDQIEVTYTVIPTVTLIPS